MGKSVKNFAIILGLLTVAFAGYYFYGQRAATTDFTANEQTMQDMLNNTRVFIGYGQQLSRIRLDISFFEDERFLSLQSFDTPIQPRPIGRPDPFAEVSPGATRVTTPSQ